MSSRKRSAYAAAGRAAYKKGLRRRPIKTRRYLGPPVVPGYTRTVSAYRRARPGAAEKKYLDTSIINIGNVSAGIILNSLNLIPQGTTDVTRIGNKVRIKNINLHGFASMDDFATAAYGGGSLRVILFVDKQCNGATANVTDILKTATIDSFRNLDQVDRFIILKDKTMMIPINSANALHTGVDTKPWRMSIRCNFDVHFSSTTGAITELRSNNVGLLFISDSAAVNAAFAGTARVKFIDL